MKKKIIITFTMTLLLILCMMPATSLAANADIGSGDSPYNLAGHSHANGDTITISDGSSVTLEGDPGTTYNNFKIVCGSNVKLTLSDVNIDDSANSGVSPLVFTGTGNTLTLADGTTSTLKGGATSAGVCAASGAVLTIGGTGTLNATGGSGGAGIGGGNSVSGGTINISGGKITANGGTVYYHEAEKDLDYYYSGGAGIGSGGYSGDDGTISGGTINISGGTITANGGDGAAGIGGGYNGSGGTITISKDSAMTTITATGGSCYYKDNETEYNNFGGAGIGGGYQGSGGTIKIYGGDITATGGQCDPLSDSGAGIGDGGNSASGGSIEISGGTIKAYGGQSAPGIGTGSITITDGNITASGGSQSAGIGGGNEGSGGTITISGGEITTTGGGDGGAGIGGGYRGSGGTIIISGGEITTTGTGIDGMGIGGAGIGGGYQGSGGTITVSGGKITATGKEGASGIGGGVYGPGGTITISEDSAKTTIIANGSSSIDGNPYNGGAGIGGGYQGSGGTIKIYGGTITATGGDCYSNYAGGAGIGGGGKVDSKVSSSGDIYIYGGDIKAKGGNYGGAGIGSGGAGHAGGQIIITNGNITITDGNVYAQGGYDCAGIGGGVNADGGHIIISGGTVTATGGVEAGVGGGGAGIGGGACISNLGVGGAAGSISISGGVVYASSAADAYDIGGGYGYTGTDGSLTISGTAAVFLRHNSSITPTGAPKTHSKYTYDKGTTTVYGISIPSAWTDAFGAYLRVCKLSYDANGGSGAPSAVSKLYGSTASIDSASGVTYGAYTFTGWNTKADGTGTAYKENDKFTLSGTDTLYAQWDGTDVTVISSNTSYGSVSGGKEYEPGTSVTVTATPNPGYYFAGWYNGDTLVSTTASYTFTAGDDVTLTAHFALSTKVTVTSGNTSYGTVSGGGDYTPGTPVTLTATAKTGYYFAGWYNGNVLVSASSTYTFSAAADINLIAQFDKIGIPETITAAASAYNKITVRWSAVTGAKGYYVYRATAADGKYKRIGTSKKTSYVNSGVATGTTYYYKVAAYSKSYTGKFYSAIASAASALGKVTGVTAKSSNPTKAIIKWKAVAGAKKYQVLRSGTKDGTYTVVKTTSSKTITDTKLISGNTYYYKVVALSGAAHGLDSDIVSVTVKAAK